MLGKKIKILVVTYFPWNNNLSTGNTISNIFDQTDDVFEFANIYIRDGVPNNDICKKYFCVSEKQLMKSIFTRKAVGDEKSFDGILDNTDVDKTSHAYNKARQLRWDIFLLLQDMIGLLGNWKSDKLDKYVRDFSPDIIFGPLGRIPLTNNLMVYLHQKFNVPLVTYPWDDHYSLKKKSFSPFFWLKTFVERRPIRYCAANCEFLYTITAQMQKEYSHYFNKKCRLLYKSHVFKNPQIKTNVANCKCKLDTRTVKIS